MITHYFVDEAGDGTIFDRKGRVIIGQEGCSQHFLMGLLHLPDPLALQTELNALRAELLADPYFQRVPSMQPTARKTAVAFHAKDDPPEVRWEVYKLLRRYSEARFFAVVRDKRKVLLEVQRYTTKRYHPNMLYDQLIPRLFRERLHQSDAYQVTFATRGKSDRTQALRTALEVARKRFRAKWNVDSTAPIDIQAVPAAQAPCLQAADYFLWAVQRCYEWREDRYLAYLWPQIHLVHDIDDVRERNYGVYYTQKKPLTADKLPVVDETDTRD